MQNALLIVNPQSRNGQSKALDEAIDVLRNSGIEVDVFVSESASQMVSGIKKYRQKDGFVIVAGGDGTISSALDAIYKTKQTLAILPLGTANDLARSLGVPQDIVAAAQVIIEGKRERIDVAKVNSNYFVNVAHIGLGVSVTHELTSESKKHFGMFAYLGAFINAIKHNKSFKVNIKADGWDCSVRAIHLAVGNGRYYGGGNIVDEDATLLDGQFNLFYLKPQRWWQLLLLGTNLRTGNLQTVERVVCRTAKKISIRTSKPRQLHADGEFKTETPAEFEVIPKAIETVVGDMPPPNKEKD